MVLLWCALWSVNEYGDNNGRGVLNHLLLISRYVFKRSGNFMDICLYVYF